MRWYFTPYRTPWPKPAPVSKVHDLDLTDMGVPSSFIANMIECCQALQSFHCDRQHDMELDDEDETTEDWCQGILNSLKLHSHSLKELLLEPWDYELTESSDSGFDRFNFRLFKALEVLEVPSMILMGRPPGAVTNGEWSPTGEWQYPTICDVIPPNLQELILTMTPDYTPGNQGIESVFTSGLPSHSIEDNAKVTFGLKGFNLTYNKISHDRALPMDFWRIQNAYRKAGLEFQYSISMFVDDSE